MEVVGEEAVGQEGNIHPAQCAGHAAEKILVVCLAEKDPLAIHAPVVHVEYPILAPQLLALV
jgi:hypothetical protein